MTHLAELERAAYTLAQHCAERIWKDHGKAAIPIDLLSTTESLSLLHYGTKDLPPTVRGLCLELSPGKGGIAYRTDASFYSRRWTIAHELGHWCLSHVNSFGAPTSNLPHNQELEADTFAGALLIPPSDLRKFAKQVHPTLMQIEQRYQVTSAMASVAVQRPGILKYIH